MGNLTQAERDWLLDYRAYKTWENSSEGKASAALLGGILKAYEDERAAGLQDFPITGYLGERI